MHYGQERVSICPAVRFAFEQNLQGVTKSASVIFVLACLRQVQTVELHFSKRLRVRTISDRYKEHACDVYTTMYITGVNEVG